MLDIKTSQILIVVSILTMIITPFILNNIRKITNVVEDIALNTNAVQNIDSNIKLKNYLVVFGYGRLGQEVVQKSKIQAYLILF